jgi:translation initiation factor 1 (eIF-1/SUI1)
MNDIWLHFTIKGNSIIIKKSKFDKSLLSLTGFFLSIRRGTVKDVVITEDKRGRHVVIHVTGLEHFGLDPKEVAKACAKKFAVSATTAKLPGKGKNSCQETRTSQDPLGWKEFLKFEFEALSQYGYI